MSTRRLLVLSMLAFTLTACSAQTMQPNFEHNPHPKDAYKLRVVFKDLPGPLVLASASATYGISNLPCAVVSKHPTHANQPIAYSSFVMNKIAENTYEGMFYTDAMIDKDYFGNGICHWYLESVGAAFTASNAPRETVFSVSFPMMDTITHEPSEYMRGVHTTMYFAKMDYPRVKEIDDYPAFGEENRQKLDKLRDDELFQAEVSLDKVTTP